MRQLVLDAAVPGARQPLAADDVRRLRKVLRMRDGDAVAVLDPAGNRHGRGVLAGSDLVVAAWEPCGPDPHPGLTVALTALKGDRAERAARSLFELGASGVYLLEADRAGPGGGARLLRRLRAAARAACEQSGRRHLPHVGGGDLAGVLGEGATTLVAHPGGGPIPAAIEGPARLLIGPEGGFTAGEVEQAARRGAVVVSPGGHILRAETAAVALSALVLARMGWFR